jgi:ABC-2 type transport system ATP-binding protein
LHKGRIILSENLETLKSEYLQPIYDIEFEENCNSDIEQLKNIKWIENVKCNRNKLSVYVKNIDTAKHDLLSEIIKFNNPVISYNIRKSTLEDIFIRQVNGNVCI